MKTFFRMLLILFLAAGCTALLAQQDTGTQTKMHEHGKSDKMQAQSGSMPMLKPAPEMTKLIDKLSGTWKTTEKAEPNPMMPNGGTGQGMARLHPGPGNLSLMEMYNSTGAMGQFHGMGTFWWDPKDQVYHGVWCDNMTPNGCDSSGSTKWQGDNLVGTMEGEMNGQKIYSRFTYSDFKPDSFVMTMEMGATPDQMHKAMTITYTKTAEGGMMEHGKMEGKKPESKM